MSLKMIDSFRGFEIRSKDLSHWAVILEEWLLIIERFSRIRKGGDSPYGYGERPNVGLLAGAAWRSGCIALNEFAHQKNSEGALSKGRADLVIESPTGSDVIEAKFEWVELGTNFASKTGQLLNRAGKDAKRSFDSAIHTRALGVAFSAGFILGNQAENMRQRIIESVEGYLKIDSAFIAYCFPEPERRVRTPEGNFTPGIFMAGIEVR